MSHWLDQAAAGLAAGAISRREVLRRGGAAAGGAAAGVALLGSITTPVAALAAAGGTRCPDGHHCGPREQCCKHDCCDKRTEQCCEGRCVSKGRECCRESRSDEGRVCERHQRCCLGDGKCYSPADDDCCFEAVGTPSAVCRKIAVTIRNAATRIIRNAARDTAGWDRNQSPSAAGRTRHAVQGHAAPPAARRDTCAAVPELPPPAAPKVSATTECAG
jgi:hypothetical protein